MPYDIHPLNELAGGLPALQIMIFTIKEHGIDLRFVIALAWRLHGWFRLIRGLASTLFGEDGWEEEAVIDSMKDENTLIRVLRIARKST